MGRESTPLKDIPEGPLRLSLNPLHVNRKGYDKGGVFWGEGLPVYLAQNNSGRIAFYVRAESREKAKEAVVALVPHATFMRR